MAHPSHTLFPLQLWRLSTPAQLVSGVPQRSEKQQTLCQGGRGGSIHVQNNDKMVRKYQINAHDTCTSWKCTVLCLCQTPTYPKRNIPILSPAGWYPRRYIQCKMLAFYHDTEDIKCCTYNKGTDKSPSLPSPEVQREPNSCLQAQLQGSALLLTPYSEGNGQKLLSTSRMVEFRRAIGNVT